jgi:hypothetical protein
MLDSGQVIKGFDFRLEPAIIDEVVTLDLTAFIPDIQFV